MTPFDSIDLLVARLRKLTPAERGASLEQACIDNPDLNAWRWQIVDQLAEDESSPAAADQGAPSREGVLQMFQCALEVNDGETDGARIGPYKLLQKIGEGGFGVVWMAEQQHPIRRRVALKIIKRGMDTREVIARFEVERQALALMDHPNIARVFDAGATENGRPFFVMELVRGTAITQYCDDNRLTSEARLRLFIAVCQAVQHAHQKGVLHRDLKPSNILVTLHDGVPVPKIIDFGIAKATGTPLTNQTLFTQFHAFLGTPAYTSPEQMELSGLDVDTRSDIYSLGVLLYELLTGRPPFDPDALAKSGLEAMRHTIREIDPPRPSHQLRTRSAADRTAVAERHRTDQTKLLDLLRGDLDWVVMRCLEKDRSRRYDTAAALALDVQRHLAHEAVLARPPGRIYKTRKFIRRHQLGVAAGTAVAVSVLGGLLLSSALFVRERSAHHRAVAAEHQQGELRHRAEVARTAEMKRAARTALELANRSLQDGRVADGLAYLVYAARKNPSNSVLAPRIASVLSSHNFALPEEGPFECGSRVVAIRFSLDGQTFSAGTEDGTLRVFESATGKLSREFRLGAPVLWASGWVFPRHNDRIFGARFQDNTFALFDSDTGHQRGPLIQLDASVRPAPHHVRLSPSGRWLVAIGLGRNRLWRWDTHTDAPPIEHRFAAAGIWDFDFSPDERRFSVVSGNEVRLWSLPDGTPQFEPLIVERLKSTPPLTALYVRFFPDNRRFGIFDPYEGIRIHDSTTGAALRPLIAAESPPGDGFGEFSPDGRLLHGGRQHRALRNLDTGQLTLLPVSPRGEYGDRCFSQDGALLLTISNGEGLVRVWDTTDGKPAAEATMQFAASIRGALSPDGTRIVVGTAKGEIHRLRLGRGEARPLVLSRAMPAKPLLFLPEPPARLLWMTSDHARVLDVASGRFLAGGYSFPRKLTGRAPGEGSAKSSIRADLRFLVVRNGPAWEAWELSSRGVVNTVPLREAPADAWGRVTFSLVGDLVAISSGSTLRVWNLRTGSSVGPVIDCGRPLLESNVNFSPDGRRLSAGYLGAPSVWDVVTGKPSPTLHPLVEDVLVAVPFSPDGSQILTAYRKGEAQLRSASNPRALGPVLYHTDALSHAVFSPDGQYFVTRTNSEVRIWKTNTSALVGEPIQQPGGRDLRFSPDSRRIVAVSENDNARVFDVRTAQVLTEPLEHGPVRIPTGIFSPDGRFVRTETTATDFRIWSVPPPLPDGAPVPEWLLQLATALAGQVVNDEGRRTAVTDTAARVATLRAQIAGLPTDDALAEWGRWILDDRADRSIAPGFSVTPEEAHALARAVAAKP